MLLGWPRLEHSLADGSIAFYPMRKLDGIRNCNTKWKQLSGFSDEISDFGKLL